jgi:hypothetical protein
MALDILQVGKYGYLQQESKNGSAIEAFLADPS